ncbi:hypothetical protein R1flu_000170 [Riccia fluitans]|uniref:Uncharacterized protein n=1 Tax=Riccia fluitans TaxID=41844 RepID=A0ABD1XZP9_9MARC
MFQPRNGRANAEDVPLHRITNCLTMRQWRRLIGLCRVRRPTPEMMLSSRRSRLFQSMAIHPVVPTRLPRPPTIGFEELSLLTRDEVFPHLKLDRLKTEGILFIDGSVFAKGAAGSQGQLPVNVSREGLKEYLVFPGSEDSSRVVTASTIEVEFLRRTGHKSLKDAWTTASLIIGMHCQGMKGGLLMN